MSKFFRIGLALGGGGARGLAHLGVLCGLEQERIAVDIITGTSMGALVAGVYAFFPQGQRAVDRFRRYLASPEFKKTDLDFLRAPGAEELAKYEGIFHRFTTFIKKGIFYSQSLTKRAPISEENFAQNINFLLDDVQIQQAQIPLGIIALDLKKSQEVVLRKGSLRQAVRASCAIPGILPPVKIGEWQLVDGGWINRVPALPARQMGADLVLAVDVSEGLDESKDFNTGLEIFLRAYEISYQTLSNVQLAQADVVIRPNVSGVHWSDFSHIDECVGIGQQALREKMGEIKSLIRRKKMQRIFRLPFRASTPQ